MNQMPEWLEVRDLVAPPKAELTRRLDPGEAEAIQLATELHADFLLIDERRGRNGGRSWCDGDRRARNYSRVLSPANH